MQEQLTPEQEAEARQLARELAEAAQGDFLQLARTLIAAPKGQLFGATEFKVRDIVLRMAAQIYQQRLGQKKRLRRVQPDLPALPAGRGLPRRAGTGPDEPCGNGALPEGLLLLPPLRHGLLPLR